MISRLFIFAGLGCALAACGSGKQGVASHYVAPKASEGAGDDDDDSGSGSGAAKKNASRSRSKASAGSGGAGSEDPSASDKASGDSSGSASAAATGTGTASTSGTASAAAATPTAAEPAPAPQPAAPAPQPAQLAQIFRLVGPEHLYSLTNNEGAPTFHLEGPAFFTLVSQLSGSIPLLRCHTAAGTHFLSQSAACEGQLLDGPMGFMLQGQKTNTRLLSRCVSPNAADHLAVLDTQECVNAGYTVEGPLGWVPNAGYVHEP